MAAASEGLRRIIARKEDGAQLWFEEALNYGLRRRCNYGGTRMAAVELVIRRLGEGFWVKEEASGSLVFGEREEVEEQGRLC